MNKNEACLDCNEIYLIKMKNVKCKCITFFLINCIALQANSIFIYVFNKLYNNTFVSTQAVNKQFILVFSEFATS